MQKIFIIFLSYLIMSCDLSSTRQDETLKTFFQDQWEQSLENYPEYATYLGDHRYNDRLTDMSLNAITKRQIETRTSLDELQQIDRNKLSAEYQLYYDLYLDRLNQSIEGQQYKEYLMPIDQMGGIQISAANLVDNTPFETETDYQNYLQRLRALPVKINQTIKLMKKGIQDNFMPPQIVLTSVPEQINKQHSYTLDESPFYHPFLEFPDEFDAELKQNLSNNGEAVIKEQIYPAFERLENFFTNEYLPNARQNIGASSTANGIAYYQFKVKSYTTTDLSVQEIRDIGLSEVDRIHKEMEEIISGLEFDGSFSEFLTFLRTDPQFYHKDAESLLDGYRALCKKVDAELPELFMTLPRTPYGVKPIPEYQAPSAPTAYYHGPSADGKRAGFFWANTYQLDTRPKYEMAVLALHEAVPGHHLQIALANELENVPEFRKHSGYTAYVEGWALYAESLGEEMEMYEDPYDKFGQLTYEMWRACRLVIDTGIHAFGWSRQQAIDYLLINSAKTKHDAEVEIDRYIIWPGQALAYKIGELKIKELKELAEAKLGDEFDIREFHHIILKDGAMPLNILEDKINSFIQNKL